MKQLTNIKRSIAVAVLSVAALLTACKGGAEKPAVAELATESDSLAYIIGMNLAENLLKMDSTINLGVVCRAIAEHGAGNSLINSADARDYYLKYYTYILPERRRGYEQQYLADLAKADRTYTRTKSGLTYQVLEIGDEKFTPRYNNDLVKVRYTITRMNGDTVVSSYIKGDTIVSALDDLQEGVKESVKMLGKGGKIEAWMPSELAYGETGDEELEVEPFETLLYNIELVEMEKYGANKLKTRFNNAF